MTNDLLVESAGTPPDTLRVSMEADYRRCLEQKEPYSVLSIEVVELARLARDGVTEGAILRAVMGLLQALPRAGALLAYRSNARILATLPGTALESLRDAWHDIFGRAQQLVVDTFEQPLSVALAIGQARAQESRGLPLECLVRVAHEGANVASFRGGRCCVHTMLYDSVQSSLQRERGNAAEELPVEPVVFRATAPVPPVTAVDQKVAGKGSECPPATQEPAPDARRAEACDSIKVARLKTRVAKLIAALADSERRRVLAETSSAPDTGVASRYHGVQGLPRQEASYSLKRTLLHEIFVVNLELFRPPVAEGTCRA